MKHAYLRQNGEVWKDTPVAPDEKPIRAEAVHASTAPLRGLYSLGVEAQDLWFSYSRSQYVLKGISLRVEGGITMILGISGSGKTTLLKLIKGLLKPQEGTIHLLDDRTPRKVGRDLSRQVAYIPQHLGLVRSLTVMDNALTGALGRMGTLASLLKVFPKEWVEEAEEVLETLGIRHKLQDKVYDLSGGERQRVAIARALMQRPRLILADEFVSQLDPVTTLEIMDIFKEISSKGVTLLVTTHELDIVFRYGDRIMVLRDGEKVLDGAAAQVTPEAVSLVMR